MYIIQVSEVLFQLEASILVTPGIARGTGSSTLCPAWKAVPCMSKALVSRYCLAGRTSYAGIDCDILWTQEEKSEDANNCISATFCYYKGESVGIWVFEYLFEGNLICRNS